MNIARLQAPSDGLNTEAQFDSVPAKQAPVLANLIPRRGAVFQRGPLREGPDISAAMPGVGGPGLCIGHLVRVNSFGVAQAAIQFDGVLVPYFLDEFGAVTGDVSAMTWGGAIASGELTEKRYATLSDWTYGVMNSGSGNDHLVAWNVSGTTLLGRLLATAPEGIASLANHLDRLWALGGILTGMSTSRPNVLVYSDIGGPGDGSNLNSWKDDVSGLINQIYVNPDTTDRPVALGQAGDDLVIFFERSVWRLRGRTTAEFTVKRVTDELGAIRDRAVVNVGESCYFLSRQGFWRYDGIELTHLSGDVRDDLVSAVDAMLDATAGIAHATHIGDGTILLVIGHRPTSPNYTFAPLFSKVYDTHTGVWWDFSSAAAYATAPHAIIRADGNAFGIDGREMFDMRHVAIPEAAATPKGIDQVREGSDKFIPAAWTTRLASLGSPAAMSQLYRVLLDYKGAAPLTLSVKNRRAESLLASTAVPSAAATGGGRFQAECRAETDDAQVVLAVDTTQAATGEGDLMLADAHIEFQTPGRHRPTKP